MENDEDLEELRKKRMLQLQQQLIEAQKQEEVRTQIEAQKQSILRQILTPDARSRIARLQMVRPQLAEQLVLQLISLAESGRVNVPITDEQLKTILKRLKGQQRETKITFKQK